MNEEIVEILEGIYGSKILRKTMVPLFLSSPGQGKSKTIKQFAKSKGKKMVKITLSQRMPNEVVGMLMPDANSGKMVIFDSAELLSLNDGDILFIDEVFNGTLKQTLDALLNFLEDRRLPSGKKVADVLIVGASNPQGMMPLTPQIKERFVRYDLAFNPLTYANYLNAKYGMPISMGNRMASLVAKEKFDNLDKWNFSSGRSLEKNMVAYCLDVKTPYKPLLEPILKLEIEVPMDLPEVGIKKGDMVQYKELVKAMVSDPEETVVTEFVKPKEEPKTTKRTTRLVTEVTKEKTGSKK